MKRFIDDIAIEVIEAKLISPLGGIFTPVAVSIMSVDLVTSMAGESEENRAQREQLTKQLDVLTKGSDTCKRFIGLRLLSKTSPYLFYFSSCLNPGQVQMMAQLNPTLNAIKTLQAISPLSLTRVLSFRLRKTLDLRRMNLQDSGTQPLKDLSA